MPAVAIAGITQENVDEVISTGVRAIAVTAAVISAPGVTELALKGPKAWLLKLFSPYGVRVYSWDRPSTRFESLAAD